KPTNGSLAAARSTNESVEVFVGTGSIIEPSGIIITNKHVIEGAALIRVTFHDKSEVPAQLIAAASLVDLALLKVNVPEPLPVLRFGNSDALKIGEPVIAIGNPLGLGTSVSTGVVSAVNRDLMRSPFDDFIQTDATINPGNSGGPLLDCAGDMIGVNTALLSNSKVLGSIGLGFALPSNEADFVANKLRNPETAEANWTGLHLQDLTAELAATFKMPDTSGAVVTGVDPGSPAAQAALVPGDVIKAVDQRELPDSRAILRAILALPIGQPISLTVWRDGQVMQATTRGQPWPHLKALRSEVLASADAVARVQQQGLGLHVVALTAADRQRLGLPPDAPGVTIDRVAAGSQAEARGLKPGEVIQQIGNQPVTDPAKLMQRLVYGNDPTGDLISVLVRGKAGPRWVALYVGRVHVMALVAAPPGQSIPGAAMNAAAALRQGGHTQ
ncbi:MAG TPA: trypsin-like peptidase domain-containing protein, partial [Acetobacteraceae bacterium]|nr:trypsin-like peptidase domain-containing protein [Acetobacteraceae bacterium]